MKGPTFLLNFPENRVCPQEVSNVVREAFVTGFNVNDLERKIALYQQV